MGVLVVFPVMICLMTKFSFHVSELCGVQLPAGLNRDNMGH